MRPQWASKEYSVTAAWHQFCAISPQGPVPMAAWSRAPLATITSPTASFFGAEPPKHSLPSYKLPQAQGSRVHSDPRPSHPPPAPYAACGPIRCASASPIAKGDLRSPLQPSIGELQRQHQSGGRIHPTRGAPQTHHPASTGELQRLFANQPDRRSASCSLAA